MTVEPVEDRRELVDRASDRPARAGRVLEQEPEPVVRQLEELAQGGHDAGEAPASPSPRCEPTWKTTPSAPIAEAVSSDARIAATDLAWISGSGSRG